VGCYLPAKASDSKSFKQPEFGTNQAANNKLWVYKVLPALLLVCCCWLAVNVANKGLASAYYFKANYYLELWQRKADTLNADSWQQAADAIGTAVKNHPTHPHYLLTQAKINEWGWYKGLKTAEQIAVNEQLYQNAITLRPGWPNAYADYAYYLAMVHFRISEAFEQLAKARLAGPYTSEVFQRTLVLATTHWTLLNGEQKALTFEALTQLVKNSQATYSLALQIARDNKLVRPFCLYLRLKESEFTVRTYRHINKDFCSNSIK
jgi:hypothetical protein